MSAPAAEAVLPAAATQAATPPRRAWRGVPTWMLLAPSLVYLLLVFGVPLANTFWMSVAEPSLGMQNYQLIAEDPIYLRVFLRTVLVAGSVTALCLLLGYPLAYYMARAGGLVGALLLAACGLCFWISFLIRTYAWQVILGNRGPVTTIARWLGVESPPVLLFTTAAALIAMTHILLPYMVLTLYVVLARIDPTLIRAAHGLGASRQQTFTRVILPLSVPAVVSGCLLVFIFCVGFYVTPTLLGSSTDMMIASLIASEIENALDFGAASALSMVLLAAVLVLLAVYDRLVDMERLVR